MDDRPVLRDRTRAEFQTELLDALYDIGQLLGILIDTIEAHGRQPE
jgi:hypothetical protein